VKRHGKREKSTPYVMILKSKQLRARDGRRFTRHMMPFTCFNHADSLMYADYVTAMLTCVCVCFNYSGLMDQNFDGDEKCCVML